MSEALTIPVEVLRRALAAVSSQQVRYYLCGVRVALEMRPKGLRLIVQATNGHYAYSWARNVDSEGAEPFDIIIPTDGVKAAMKLVPKRATEIIVSPQVIGGVSTDPIDGQFPDVKRIAPESISGELAWYNPHYLAKIADAISGKRGGRPMLDVRFNGLGPAIIRDEVGVWLIMPIRHDNPGAMESTAPLLDEHF